MTQAELARRTGISRATIQRLERGEIEQPSVRMLANCAMVLGAQLATGVRLEDLIEDEWREWYVLRRRQGGATAGAVGRPGHALATVAMTGGAPMPTSSPCWVPARFQGWSGHATVG
jgi:DNA-binding XRE family transcriptional regulator